MGGWPSLWAGEEASISVSLGSALFLSTFSVLFRNVINN